MAMLGSEAKFKLKGGIELCRVINGCWQLAGGHGPITSQILTDFEKLVDTGFNTFDTADIYGPSESIIGKFLQIQNAKTPKKEAVICTKFVPSYGALPKFRPEFADKSIERSLQRLGVQSLDVVAMHWWDYTFQTQMLKAGLALNRIKGEGKIKAIGVTNTDTTNLKALLDAGVEVECNQVQYSVLDRRPRVMAKFCEENDIRLICYGSLSGGFLSSKWLGFQEPPLESFETVSQRMYWRIIQQFGGWNQFQELLQVLAGVASKHAVSIANVAAKWVLQQPAVGAVIIGVRNAKHIEDNKRIFSFALDDEDLRMIDGVKHRGPYGDCYTMERGG